MAAVAVDLVVQALGFFAALVLLRAALHKVLDRHRFAGILASYRILPDRAAPVVAGLLPGAEAVIVLALVIPQTRSLGLLGAAALVAAYAAAMALNLARGRVILDCGCGGPPAPLSWGLVGRNVLLAAPLGLAGLREAGALSILDTVAGTGIGLLAFTVTGAVEQALANRRLMASLAPFAAAQGLRR